MQENGLSQPTSEASVECEPRQWLIGWRRNSIGGLARLGGVQTLQVAPTVGGVITIDDQPALVEPPDDTFHGRLFKTWCRGSISLVELRYWPKARLTNKAIFIA